METAWKKCFYAPLLGFAMFITVAASAGGSVLKSENMPENDRNLDGQWGLDSLEMTTMGVTQKYSIDYLLANVNHIPANMFISLYFDDSDLAIQSRELLLNPRKDSSMKGNFSTENGILTVTMRGETEARKFAYKVNGDFLKMQYTLAGVNYNLVFKCTFRPL